MNALVTLYIVIFTFALYYSILIFLKSKGLFEKYNLSFYGPLLMWRTEKGKGLIKRLAVRKKFWRGFGTFGIILCFIVMILMIWLLVWQLSILRFIPEKSIPGAEMVVAIPGINPILPIGYTILGLLVAIVFHEFSHGILGVVGKIKIKSLGVLSLLVPIGAFVEPDEEELKKMDTIKRMRVFAAGPTMNLVVAIVSIFLLSFVFMASVQPAADGVGILYVQDGTPASSIGLVPGDIITDINGTKITGYQDFFSTMNKTEAGQSISMGYVMGSERFKKTVTLGDKYRFINKTENIGKGFLGVTVISTYKQELTLLKNPAMDFPFGFLHLYGLPIIGYSTGYNPLIEPYTNFYIVKGFFSFIPQSIFWITVNMLYWIFWLNFAVGVFNVLPIIPLDGGYIFQDSIDLALEKSHRKMSKEKKERIIKTISVSVSVFTLILVFAPLLFKYLGPLFT